MSDDEVAEYVSQKKKKTQETIKQTRDGRKQTEWFQQTIKIRKEDIALIKKVAEKMGVSFEEAYNMLHGGDELKKKVSSKKESKETLTKSLEFEEDTFKIDSKGWKEEKRNVYNKGEMKVKVNATWDVVEYLEWPAKWEQIFITYDAFIREVMKAKNCSKEEVEQKYLMTVDELKEKMKDKPDRSDEYKKFFNKEVKGHLAGYWNPNNDIFSNIGERSHVWLAGGDGADFDQYEWSWYNFNRNYGFSGRLLKN